MAPAHLPRGTASDFSAILQRGSRSLVPEAAPDAAMIILSEVWHSAGCALIEVNVISKIERTQLDAPPPLDLNAPPLLLKGGVAFSRVRSN